MSICVWGYYLTAVFSEFFLTIRVTKKVYQGYLSCYNGEKGGQKRIMPHQIKVTDELYDRLKARAAGRPIPQLIRALLDGGDFKDGGGAQPVQTLPGTEVDMSDWVDGDAPECCIDTIANDFKPGHVCPDWVRLEYTDKNGVTRQGWYNKRIGEFEFSEKWKKIKADYRYE